MASAEGSGVGSSPNKWSGSSDTDGLNGAHSSTNYTPSSARKEVPTEAEPMPIAIYGGRPPTRDVMGSIGAADRSVASALNGLDPSSNIVFQRPARSLDDIRGLDGQESRDLEARSMPGITAMSGFFGKDRTWGDVLTPMLYCGGINQDFFHAKVRPFDVSWAESHRVVRIHHSTESDETWLSFDDLRECRAAKEDLVFSGGAVVDTGDWNLRHLRAPTLGCIGPHQFWRACGVQPYATLPASNTAFVGMVLIQVVRAHANVYARQNGQTADELLQVVLLRLRTIFGTKMHYIKALGYVDRTFDEGLPTMTFVVEFNHIEFADQYAGLNGRIERTPYDPYHMWAMPFCAEVLHPDADYSRVDEGLMQTVQEFRARRFHGEAQANGIQAAACFGGMLTSAGRAGNRNSVDLGAVLEGRDVRTTIMLRNIPNRMTHVDLKNLVDQVAFGQYDFLYLRIDFANNCNVGYAFINFITAIAVYDFVGQVRGQKWLHSDKYADCSYATIQGRETLIEKFRNSSVMNERLSARPRLYWPFTAPEQNLVGQEEAFPAPNNYVKLSRSVDNARAIGLYNPVRGAGSFDRRRRGQFDRGTSYSAMEQLQAENSHWHNTTPQGQAYHSHAHSPAYF